MPRAKKIVVLYGTTVAKERVMLRHHARTPPQRASTNRGARSPLSFLFSLLADNRMCLWSRHRKSGLAIGQSQKPEQTSLQN